jgi:hypothetical protein
VRGLPGEWLVQVAVGCTFEDPGDLGEQIGPAARELAEFGHRGVLLVLGLARAIGRGAVRSR